MLGCYDDRISRFVLDSAIISEEPQGIVRTARSLEPSPDYFRWMWRLRGRDSLEVTIGMIEASSSRAFLVTGDSLVGVLTHRCEA